MTMMRTRMHAGFLAAGLATLACSGSSDDPGSKEEELGCGLSTGWEGDENCIAPPPAELGFQLHYGPSNYDDQGEVEKYLIQPGVDTNIYHPLTATNPTDVYFYKRQYRMRPGSHHLIVTTDGGAGSFFGTGRRLGGSQNAIKDNPAGPTPEENQGIGMPLAANASVILNLHHFNAGQKPLLREAWINFWYVDKAQVTQEAQEIFLWAMGRPIEPGASDTVRGKKTITGDGRILTLYGHRHSNNVRFSAYRTRDGNRELIFDDYDWEEPAVFEFNSRAENPAPQATSGRAGAVSGTLELKAGDVIEWECDVVNRRTETITFGENEALTSEMCILVGDAIGPKLIGISEP